MDETGSAMKDGDAAALAAPMSEPVPDSTADGHTHEAKCLNCGSALIGSHCHQCGQAAHVHKTIAAFFHDLAHGVFHFEGKIWRTLPLLAWHPGRLTREYIDGRRASYVSPIALFLFVVFLTFALFSLASKPVHFDRNNNMVLGPAGTTAESMQVKYVTSLKAELAAAQNSGQATRPLEKKLAGAETALAQFRSKKITMLPAGIAQGASVGGGLLGAALSTAWQTATDNPDLALYKLRASAYKYSWLMIPLSVPFVWLLFPFNRRFHLYDHTVFVTYSLCFMLLVLAAMTAINVWTSLGGLIALLMLYGPFHMHRQLRETYGLTRVGALWRTAMLAIFSMITLTLFSLTVLGLSIT